MPIGIAGDSVATPNIEGLGAEDYSAIELRVLSQLIQNLLGTNQAIDLLPTLRQDVAFELGIPLPPPING